MTRLMRVLLLVVVAELAVAGYFALRRASEVRPPLANLARLDRRTAAEIGQIRSQVRSDDPATWESLGQAYLSFGFFAEAEACLAHAAQLQVPSHELLLSWGASLDRLGRLDDAVTQYKAAARLADGQRRDVCWYHVARCLLRKQDHAGAQEALREAGEFALARYELAKLLARTGHPEEAANILDALLASNPQELKLNQLRARVATDLGDAPTARRCRDLLEQSQDRLFVDSTVEYIGLLRAGRGLPRLRAKTVELEQAGQFAGAASELTASQKLEWDLITARRLVRLNVRLGRLDEALAVLAQMTERFGTSPEFLEQQGDVAALQGRTREAAQLWQQAVRLRPSARLHDLLADAAERNGDAALTQQHRARSELCRGLDSYRSHRDAEAAAQFQAAVELDPQLADAWFYLGQLQRAGGDVAAAEASYRRCLELRPHSGRAMDALASLAAPAP